MKIFILSLSVFLFGVSNCFGQAFHYDTIPAPKQSQEQPLFTIEQPTQQSTNQRKTITSEPQYKNSGFKKENLVLGGSFGLGFGSGYSSISISPQVGYQFNRYFTAGGGISYFYYKNDWNNYNYSQNYLGLNVYGKVNPIPFISLQIQPELYGMWGSAGGQSLDSKTVPCVLAGAGINIPTGGRGAINMMVYYDLVQNEWSPYGDDLFYSIGYTFGF